MTPTDAAIPPPSADDRECDACGTFPTSTNETIRVHMTNGSLRLCRQCLDDINRKSPLLAEERRQSAAAKQNLGNLLACIFRDGGHRQAEIGDDAKAVEEAAKVWAELITVSEESAAVREVLRPVLGKVECEVCRPIPKKTCTQCHGTGTRDVIDGLTLGEAVNRVAKWYHALDDALVVDWCRKPEHDADPRKALNDLICANQQIALDPFVSEEAAKLRDTYLAERDTARATVEQMRERIIALFPCRSITNASESNPMTCEMWNAAHCNAGGLCTNCEAVAAIRALPLGSASVLEPVKEPT